jgi:hypothetical protein
MNSILTMLVIFSAARTARCFFLNSRSIRTTSVVAQYYRKRPPQPAQSPPTTRSDDALLPEGAFLEEPTGSWEKWEFGDETFIEDAMARDDADVDEHGDHAAVAAAASAALSSSSSSSSLSSANAKVRATGEGAGGDKNDEDHPGNRPLRNGAADYAGGIECLRPFISEDRMEKMEAVLGSRSGRARFIIEDPINPSNAWACLRTLDSFGVQYVDVIANPVNYREGDENPRYRKMRTAMGTQKWLDMSQHVSTADCVAPLKDAGWTILATDLSPARCLYTKWTSASWASSPW